MAGIGAILPYARKCPETAFPWPLSHFGRPLRPERPADGPEASQRPGNGLNGPGVQLNALGKEPAGSDAQKVTNNRGDDGGIHS